MLLQNYPLHSHKWTKLWHRYWPLTTATCKNIGTNTSSGEEKFPAQENASKVMSLKLGMLIDVDLPAIGKVFVCMMKWRPSVKLINFPGDLQNYPKNILF